MPALASQVPSMSAADAKQLTSLAKQLEQLTTALNEQQVGVLDRWLVDLRQSDCCCLAFSFIKIFFHFSLLFRFFFFFFFFLL